MNSSVSFQTLIARGFACRVGFGYRPSLLVVDFINGFTDPASPMGSDVSGAIVETNRLISAARSANIPVFFSVIRYDDDRCADAGLWLSKISGLSLLSAQGNGSVIDPRLARIPEDQVIVKKYASCFFGTDFLSRLAHDGIDTIVIAGCTTSGCVRATAVDACQSGIRAIVAREAVADRQDDAHRQSLIDIDLKYGDVHTVDEIITRFGTIADRCRNNEE